MAQGIIAALDKLDQGDWDAAHMIAQNGLSDLDHWMHAHLHRVEGDKPNALYWYRKANRAPFDGTIDEERKALRAACAG